LQHFRGFVLNAGGEVHGAPAHLRLELLEVGQLMLFKVLVHCPQDRRFFHLNDYKIKINKLHSLVF
jgi:hypothetical protein